MGPRADGQPDIDAAAAQALVLFDHLIREPILPAVLQQDRYVDPLEGLTKPHRLPHGVLGIWCGEPLPVRHSAAGEDRFLRTDEGKLLEPTPHASAGRHGAQNALDQSAVKCSKPAIRLSICSREKAPAPWATQWLSWAVMAMTAATSSGGGSVIKAHAV